jgi:LacI family transcriptional regulator
VPYDKPVIAVIIPEAISVYYIHFIEVLKKSMEQNGYTMLLSISNFDPEMTEELMRYYTNHSRVNGMVVFGDLPPSIKKTDTVIFSVVENRASIAEGDIRLDLAPGLSAALRHLKSLGHSRIAYVGEPLTSVKASVMRSVMEKIGFEVAPELMVESLERFENAGRDGVRRLLALKNRPTAVFGAYGYITKGIIGELLSRGVSVPDEMSVISMDNDPSELHPSLDVSCIPSGIEETCLGIMTALNRALLSPNPHRSDTVRIPSKFHLGETVVPVDRR